MPDLVNLIVAPGEGTLEDLISQIDEGLVIDQILGHGPIFLAIFLSISIWVIA
jgi:predicted Zn-dependent protease